MECPLCQGAGKKLMSYRDLALQFKSPPKGTIYNERTLMCVIPCPGCARREALARMLPKQRSLSAAPQSSPEE